MNSQVWTGLYVLSKSDVFASVRYCSMHDSGYRAVFRCEKVSIPSPCILVIRRRDHVSSFTALSPGGSTETLIESIREARLPRLVRVAFTTCQNCVSLRIHKLLTKLVYNFSLSALHSVCFRDNIKITKYFYAVYFKCRRCILLTKYIIFQYQLWILYVWDIT